MEGIATTMEPETISQASEIQPVINQQTFATNVQQSLQQYFTRLDGEEPANLYGMVLAEMETPLLKMVMRFSNGNQSKAAKILGISRGTLRKKLAMYDLN